jgi:16S rRNA (guanine527-N7)-methyltransferase
LFYIKNKNIILLDVGTGGGLPGIVLSICGIEKVILVESNNKKIAFLSQAAKLSNKDVIIINDRVENIGKLSCDVVTSRAMSKVGAIFEYCTQINVRNKYLLHKGGSYIQDIEEARKKWNFNINVYNSITSLEGRVIEISSVKSI